MISLTTSSLNGVLSLTNLPELTSYTEQQWQQAFAVSSAIQRYKNLLPQAHGTLFELRHSAWLQSAMAILFNTANAETICRFWSHAADQILMKCWNEAGFKGKPAALFALGKLGAEELNLSSDVDLLLVCTSDFEAEAQLLFKKFRSELTQMSQFGWLLRLDFDLRPGGGASPIWITPERFENHYWTQGEAWERLALVRLRAITGEQNLIATISNSAKKFSFRKFLDYTLLDDLKLLRPRIHALVVEQNDGWDLKTAVGGIRDVELFAHALQVLHGGKISDLQTRSTTKAYQVLAQEQLLKAEEAESLSESYWFFRDLENKVQLVDDRQTHFLSTEASFPSLTTEQIAEIKQTRHQIDIQVSSILGSSTTEQSLELPPPEQHQQWLQQLGYSETTFNEIWPALLKASAVSRKSARDERNRLQVIRLFVEAMAREGLDPELGMALLLDFIKSTRAKATFFSLLLREPRLIRDLARLFSISPYLGGVLSSRPELIDSFIYKSQDPISENLEEALTQFSERRLLTEVFAAIEFLQNKNLSVLQESLSDTADTICVNLQKLLTDELQLQQSPSILALGKWGGREMGFRSDLDFIFITPLPPAEAEFKFARRMMSRLTEQQRGGAIYNVDLRLRPSGNSGPLIVHEQRLLEYFSTEASAWERQSYLRCRSLGYYLVNDLLRLIIDRSLSDEDLNELLEIRKKLLVPHNSTEELNLKFAHGGLVEIEFAVQNILLQQKQIPQSSSTLGHLRQISVSNSVCQKSLIELEQHYLFFRTLEQIFQLLASRSVAQLRFDSQLFNNCARVLNDDANLLKHKINDSLTAAAAILKRLDPIYSQR